MGDKVIYNSDCVNGIYTLYNVTSKISKDDIANKSAPGFF